MAFTKLYLTTKTAPYTPATIRGAWDDTAGAVTKMLETEKPFSDFNTTVSRQETSGSNTFDVLLYRGVSGPIAAYSFSGSDTINVMLGVREGNSADDFCYHLHVYVTQGDSDTPRGTLISDYVETTANEWSTTAQGQALASAQACGSVSALAGDRIVVEVGYIARNASTGGSTGFLSYGTCRSDGTPAADLTAGNTNVADRAGFILFNNSIPETTLENRVSQAPVEAVHGTDEVAISQAPVEAVHGSDEVAISQMPFLVVYGGAEIRVSQMAIEVIGPFVNSGRGAPYPNIFIVT